MNIINNYFLGGYIVSYFKKLSITALLVACFLSHQSTTHCAMVRTATHRAIAHTYYAQEKNDIKMHDNDIGEWTTQDEMEWKKDMMECDKENDEANRKKLREKKLRERLELKRPEHDSGPDEDAPLYDESTIYTYTIGLLTDINAKLTKKLYKVNEIKKALEFKAVTAEKPYITSQVKKLNDLKIDVERISNPLYNFKEDLTNYAEDLTPYAQKKLYKKHQNFLCATKTYQKKYQGLYNKYRKPYQQSQKSYTQKKYQELCKKNKNFLRTTKIYKQNDQAIYKHYFFYKPKIDKLYQTCEATYKEIYTSFEAIRELLFEKKRSLMKTIFGEFFVGKFLTVKKSSLNC